MAVFLISAFHKSLQRGWGEWALGAKFIVGWRGNMSAEAVAAAAADEDLTSAAPSYYASKFACP